MTVVNYAPGDWVSVVRGGTAVVLAPGTSSQLLAGVWDLLAEEPEVHEILHAVTSSFGGPLTRMPPFAILGLADNLRVFLRGEVDLTVQFPDGPVELTGRDVSTWTERRLPLPSAYTLAAQELEQPLPSLPLVEGTVLLSSLSMTEISGAGTRLTGPLDLDVLSVPAPEPALAPAPVSEGVPPDQDAGTEDSEEDVSAETVMGVPDDDLESPPNDAGTEDAALDNDERAQGAPLEAEDPAAGPEMTSSYDHLWDKTVMRSIEDAAIRDVPEEEPEGIAHTDARDGDAGTGGDSVPPGSVSALDVQPSPTSSGLIDSIPWRTAGAAPSAAAAPPSWTPSSAVPGVPVASVADAMNPAPASPGEHNSPEESPGSDQDVAGDHDGQTIMKSAVLGASAQLAPQGTPSPGEGPMVLARVCSSGHANPPTHAQCAVCHEQLPADARQVPRPRLGLMRVSTGELVDLDQSLVIGRQPSVSRVQGGGMPRLVQVPSPAGDISRSHVEVRLEGWHVMLCDLKATNGTVLVRPGQAPRRLAQNEVTILLDGDIAELGDDISLRFEDIL